MRFLLAFAAVVALSACSTPSATTAPGVVVQPVSSDVVADLSAKAYAATKRRELMQQLYGNDPNTVQLVTQAKIDEGAAVAAYVHKRDAVAKEPFLIGLTFNIPILTLEDSDLCLRDGACISKAARTVLHNPTQASVVLAGGNPPGIYDVALKFTYSAERIGHPVAGHSKIAFVLK